MSEKPLSAQELLVLDSSTFIQEAGLTSRGASALKHYLRHRGTQLVVPEVVAEECERTLLDITNGKIRKVNDTLTWLGRFFGRVNGWTAPGDHVIVERAKALATAQHLRAVLLRETETVRHRAESRTRLQKPPSHRHSQPRDARIWEQCLELLSSHDVVFVARDNDFRGHGDTGELHPQLRAEAEAVGAGRKLTFYPNIDLLLLELKREVPAIPNDTVRKFVHSAAATDIDDLSANSSYWPMRLDDVSLTFLSTDQADIIEVRLELNETWKHSGDGTIATFYLRASCHYQLEDHQLQDLSIKNLRLLVPQPDGSVRAARGSYVRASAGTLYAGTAPVGPKPEVLGIDRT